MGDTFYVWVNVNETARPAAVLAAIRRLMNWAEGDTLTRRAAYGFAFDKTHVGARGEHDLCAGATTEERHAQLVEAVRKVDKGAKVETEWLFLDDLPQDSTETFGAEEEEDAEAA